MKFPWQKKKPALAFMGDLVKLVVSPGDVFVVMPKRQISQQSAEALQAAWEEHFGTESPLIVLEEGMKIGVLSPQKAAEAQKTISEIEEAAAAVDQFVADNGA